ncbi:MAG: hypothetical protein KOO60_04940 [Gemmatimonadales bacterium]|nr:hypothetical protein [Gemmatimonadales bacterium]
MKKITLLNCIAIGLLLAFCVFAGEMPEYVDGHYSLIHGGNLEMSQAANRDTLYLIGPWGSSSTVNGQFADPTGAPNWNGWTHRDLTTRAESAWHASDYNVVTGNYSAWCGEIAYEACAPDDPEGGYGPDYNELLSWYGTVEYTSAPTTVEITATVNHNTEPGYDFSNLGIWKLDTPIQYLWTADGEGEMVPVSGSATYLPGEYVGENKDQVRLTWHVTSDHLWDDSDCLYYGNGALQLDDVTVTMTNALQITSTFDGFEDGTLGENWTVEFGVGVGDYAHLYAPLNDIDPCSVNRTPQACFVADQRMFDERGLPVCEGPLFYGHENRVVHHSGGQTGPPNHIHNAIESPVIQWPTGDYVGVHYLFDVYMHEELSEVSPGIFYTWGIRSTDDPDPNDILTKKFRDRSMVYYGGPEYFRTGGGDVTDLVDPNRTYVQIQLTVYQLGYIWGYDGKVGTPAPYFDNVALKVFSCYGPTMTAREQDLAQDSFPDDGTIHTGEEMHLNDVRFDMANNISPSQDQRNDPGDSVVIKIVAVRTGAAIVTHDISAEVTAPRLYFTIKLNPAFNAGMRIGKALFTVNAGGDGELQGEVTDDGTGDGTMNGYVTGAPAMAWGIPSSDHWMFDLPEEDFLYPGDVLHYYIESWDEVSGDFLNATMPADRTGYGDFSDTQVYNASFVMHALPTMFSSDVQPVTGYPDHAKILFWNDNGDREGRDEWHGAFRNLGLFPGEDYDIYYTNDPRLGVGNGLGGRAKPVQLDGYNILIYTCGDLSSNTITNQDYSCDAGDDIGVLNDWLDEGHKMMFATGDDLVTDLNNSGSITKEFISGRMGLTYISRDVSIFLGGDKAPLVNTVPSNSVLITETWLAYGSCPKINKFDAVSAPDSTRLATFENGIIYSAATMCEGGDESVVISMPYDFMYIWDSQLDETGGKNDSAPLAVRAMVLGEILMYFGTYPSYPFATGVGNIPGKLSFDATAFPNPFNPVTKIEFTMPRKGHLSLKIFNVRGELVCTLINGVWEAGTDHVLWEGTDNQGRQVSSGVYFYEARTVDDVRINKIALVK